MKHCERCGIGKMRQKNVNKEHVPRAKEVGDRIFMIIRQQSIPLQSGELLSFTEELKLSLSQPIPPNIVVHTSAIFLPSVQSNNKDLYTKKEVDSTKAA